MYIFFAKSFYFFIEIEANFQVESTTHSRKKIGNKSIG